MYLKHVSSVFSSSFFFFDNRDSLHVLPPSLSHHPLSLSPPPPPTLLPSHTHTHPLTLLPSYRSCRQTTSQRNGGGERAASSPSPPKVGREVMRRECILLCTCGAVCEVCVKRAAFYSLLRPSTAFYSMNLYAFFSLPPSLSHPLSLSPAAEPQQDPHGRRLVRAHRDPPVAP